MIVLIPLCLIVGVGLMFGAWTAGLMLIALAALLLALILLDAFVGF